METYTFCFHAKGNKVLNYLNSSSRVWVEMQLLPLSPFGSYTSRFLAREQQPLGRETPQRKLIKNDIDSGLMVFLNKCWLKHTQEGTIRATAKHQSSTYHSILAVPIMEAQLGAKFSSCCFKIPCLASWNREEGWKDTSLGSQPTFASFTVTIKKCS